jgi:hypothetical protein
MQKNYGDMIKETGISDSDLLYLREQFVDKYAKLKGWDKSKLSSDQLNEIYQQPDYKQPGLLLS